MKDKNWEFYDSGDGVEFELWIDKKLGIWKVPIEIVRDFDKATKHRDSRADDLLWLIIDGLKWEEDPSFNRVQKLLKKLHPDTLKQLEVFVKTLHSELDFRFRDSIYGCGDDGWSDVRAEVIGRGQKYFDNIGIKTLQDMIKEGDYTESFLYCFHID